MNKQDELRNFGEKVRQYRTLNGMTLQDLADKCGYTSRSMIGKIEKGLVDVPQTKIQLIADALGVDVLDLMGRRDPVVRLLRYQELFNRLQELGEDDQKKAARLIDGVLRTFEE